ncbi:MAG: hypothetical protein KDE47_16005 [Caldilineaceae bacterium]|nr:hypothetical protein [Caldilineaceae bacterium]
MKRLIGFVAFVVCFLYVTVDPLRPSLRSYGAFTKSMAHRLLDCVPPESSTEVVNAWLSRHPSSAPEFLAAIPEEFATPPFDPWGQPFHCVNANGRFVIYSEGADMVAGADDISTISDVLPVYDMRPRYSIYLKVAFGMGAVATLVWLIQGIGKQ